MIGAIFRKQIRDGRMTVFWWSFGLAIYVLFAISPFPGVQEQQESYDDLLEGFPQAMIDAFEGIEDVSDPASYLNVQVMLFMPLILGIFGILQGLNSITGEERNQTLDTLAALPIPRWQLITEKYLATGVLLLGILTNFFLSLVLCTILFPEFDLGVMPLALACYGLFFPVMIVAGVAYVCSAALPLHRRWGAGITTAFMLGSYFVYTLGNISADIEPLQVLSFFNYYNALDILGDSFPVADFIVMLVSVVALYVAAVVAFEQRDIMR